MLAIVPARMGSRRLPNKNWRAFADGRNLVQIACEQALAADIERVVVTSDRDDRDWHLPGGCRQVRRPDFMATDDADIWHAVEHACLAVEYAGPIVLLQPTSPLRTAADIRAALALRTDNGVAVSSGCPDRNGAIYVRDWRKWLASDMLYLMPRWRSIDIDTEDDWRACQALWPLARNGG